MNIFEKIAALIAEGKTEEANKLFSEHMATEVTGLKNKNTELLNELKDAKKDKTDFMQRLEALEGEKAKAEEEALTKGGDVEKITANLKEKHAKEIAALKEAEQDLQGQLRTHVLDGGLVASLTKAGVQPELMDAASALIKSKYEGEVGNNDGAPFAKFDGKAVDEFVTDWAGSDTGKHFVSAKSNSGGGSQGAKEGGGAPGDNKTMTRGEFDKLGAAEQSKFSLEGGRLTDD